MDEHVLTKNEHEKICVVCRDIFTDSIPCNTDSFDSCPAKNIEDHLRYLEY